MCLVCHSGLVTITFLQESPWSGISKIFFVLCQALSLGAKYCVVQRVFQGSFMSVSRRFQGNLKGVSRKFQWYFK